MYYACFQAISALLVHDEIVAKSHKGLKAKFGERYVKQGSVDLRHNTTLAKLFKLRLQADYDADADFDLEDAQALLMPTKELIAAVKQLITVA